MLNRNDKTVFCVERPLNLPDLTIYPIKENKVVNVLRWIQFKTSIYFFPIGNKGVRIQIVLETLFFTFQTVLHLPHLPCLSIKFYECPHILCRKELEAFYIIRLYR